jgi:hypothetical protein
MRYISAYYGELNPHSPPPIISMRHKRYPKDYATPRSVRQHVVMGTKARFVKPDYALKEEVSYWFSGWGHQRRAGAAVEYRNHTPIKSHYSIEWEVL